MEQFDQGLHYLRFQPNSNRHSSGNIQHIGLQVKLKKFVHSYLVALNIGLAFIYFPSLCVREGNTLACMQMVNLPYRLRAKKGPAPPPPLGNFADISYLEENFKLHLLRDVCTLCSGALVSDSLLHMLL